MQGLDVQVMLNSLASNMTRIEQIGTLQKIEQQSTAILRQISEIRNLAVKGMKGTIQETASFSFYSLKSQPTISSSELSNGSND